ncbi:MAG: DUF4114 domain-containing protein [Polyangiaceae bacterium]|nr:DUF4114 domain-containing protein [Polyangiaceae bacterium]
MRRLFPLLPALALPFFASQALALSQPDGTPIPQGNGLQDLFTSRGEALNASVDAQIVPETFVPSCALTFEVLQRNAGYQNAFGWYNVTGAAPGINDLHEFLHCYDGVGTIKPLPQIKNDPAYLGGEIGFYEGVINNCGPNSGPQDYLYVFYSEKQYNPDGNQQNPYIHLLIYNSTVTPKAFYFGWEDLISGGDNDFDDLTTFVTGISCSGGGGKCQTGSPGVCADGTLQCQNGQLTCLPLAGPSNEKCDGFDNDCNGLVDDGDLCGADEVCDNGNCVPKCGGEFVCPPQKECDNGKGLCVDAECIGVTCQEGTKCIKGICKDPCNGVACPKGQACIAGNCIDPCLGITCDDSQVCFEGACIEECQCAGCTAGSQCQADGLCLPDACVGKVCPPGTYCIADGTCADACSGVVCPSGQICTEGQCVTDPNPGTGGTGGQVGVGGFGGLGGGVNGGSSPGGSGGTSAGGNGGTGGSGGSNGGGSKDSCGCSMPGNSNGFGGFGVFALLALAAIRKRRNS